MTADFVSATGDKPESVISSGVEEDRLWGKWRRNLISPGPFEISPCSQKPLTVGFLPQSPVDGTFQPQTGKVPRLSLVRKDFLNDAMCALKAGRRVSLDFKEKSPIWGYGGITARVVLFGLERVNNGFHFRVQRHLPPSVEIGGGGIPCCGSGKPPPRPFAAGTRRAYQVCQAPLLRSCIRAGVTKRGFLGLERLREGFERVVCPVLPPGS